MADLLMVERVGRTFGERVKTRVLEDVDLRVSRGESLALIGPSGSGKSTLLNLIGLLDRPTAGRILIDGVDTSSLDDEGLTALRGRTLGFVFQFHHLLPAFNAVENVMLPAWGGEGRPSRAMRARARELLVGVGLADHLERRVDEMSGGQQQRVAIARALIRAPLLVLADEPTGNLDTAAADEVFAVLDRLNREQGTTLVIVTHDPRRAARARRVVELLDGRIVRDAPPA